MMEKEHNKINLHHNIVIYLILAICISSLIFSILAFYEVKRITGGAENVLELEDFLSKINVHPELSDYKNINPLNIIQINTNNLPTLQTQIDGLDVSFINSYIVQFQDKIFIYDLGNDKILADMVLQEQQTLPPDFSTKLFLHDELKGLEQLTPQVDILDEAFLQSLKQQMPYIDKGVSVGDYLIGYPNKLIIYNYQEDKIVDSVDMSKTIN